MSKVLFINPVVREEDVPRHVPYGMALLAAIAIREGHDVQVYDANAWRCGDDVLYEVLDADQWDVIAVGGLTTTYRYVQRLCAVAKQRCPKATLVLGGGIMTSMPREIMTWIPEIDIGVIGEAFTSFPALLSCLAERGDRSRLHGLCLRDGSERPYLTPAIALISDLDTLPYPAWDLFPLEIYFRNSNALYSEEIYTSQRRIDINGSLGCNLVCRYCWHLGTTGDMLIEPNPDEGGALDVRFSYGRRIRYHSPRYIVEMVKTLVERYQVDFVSFLDENLMTMDQASGRTWLKELCRLWIDAGLQPTCRRDGVAHDRSCRGVHWSGTSHATLARPQTLAEMYRAGCSHLVYGIESFDPGVLKRLGKGATAKTNRRAIRECLKSGIKPIPNIMIGFPEESFASIRNTMKGMAELGIRAKPHFATPYPGSEWYYRYKSSIERQYGGVLEAFVRALGDASTITAVLSHRFTGMELLGLQQIVYQGDFRLLDQAERYARPRSEALATPESSFNFVPKKLVAPMVDIQRKKTG